MFKHILVPTDGKTMGNVMEKGGSPFVAPAAVEAWDTWFRWRENGVLRDETVEATWQRVASALAAVEPDDRRAAFRRRLLDAFIAWRLLLDERILATAGTGAVAWPDDALVAALDVASFVRAPGTPQAAIDFAAMKACTELAAHALDNALLLRGDAGQAARRLRIGVIGLADAFALLGLDYASVEARTQARRLARALAEGSLRATIALAEARGPTARCDVRWLKLARLRHTPVELIDAARTHGLRHAGLTSITSQPRLARFANGVADAIHPLGAGHALAVTMQHEPRAKAQLRVSVPAQLDLRAAMRPWIDEPISCPVQAYAKPSPASHLDWYARVAALGLGALSWRLVPSAQPLRQ